MNPKFLDREQLDVPLACSYFIRLFVWGVGGDWVAFSGKQLRKLASLDVGWTNKIV